MVRWILTAQFALSLLAAALGVALGGPATGILTLGGGSLAMVLTALFAWRARATEGAEPRAMLGAMYRAEAGRLIAATLIFVAVAIYMPQHFIAILAGFGAATLSYWLALPMTARLMAPTDRALAARIEAAQKTESDRASGDQIIDHEL